MEIKYYFSKFELLLKGLKPNQRNYISLTRGGLVTKVYKRKWYNPLRYIFAKNGIAKVDINRFLNN